jgi:hypothetical protein
MWCEPLARKVAFLERNQKGEAKMSNCNVIVNGIEYAPTAPTGDDVRIVILQRGWVMVGYYKREGDSCSLTKASVIRNWGTTKGLGEIAADGPKKDTKLDPTNGLVEFHRLTEVATIRCEVSKWQSELK